MKVKPKNQSQVISVIDRQPEVVKVEDDNVYIKIFFGLDASSALSAGIIKCNCRLLNIATSPTLKSKQKLGALDSSNALNAPSVRKTSATLKQSMVAVSGVVDITKSIPNDQVRKISNGGTIKRGKTFRIVGGSQNNSVGAPKNLTSIDAQIIKTSELKSLRDDLLHLQFRDPAAEVNVIEFQRALPAVMRGLRGTGNISKLGMKQRLFRKSITTDSSIVNKVKLEGETSSVIEVSYDFKIRKSLISRYKFEVDAVRSDTSVSSETTLQKIDFEVDLKRAYNDFIVTTRPPTVEINSFGPYRFINAIQNDPNGQRLRVYRRIIESTSADSQQFSLIYDASATHGQAITFKDKPPAIGKCIYRVVPFNELSSTSGVFNGKVVRSTKEIINSGHPNTASVLAIENNEGIKIRGFQIPNDVIAVRVLRRALSLNQKEFETPSTIQGQPLRQIARGSKTVEFNDVPTRGRTTYEYSLELIDIYGITRRATRNSIVHYVGDRLTSESYRVAITSKKITPGTESTVSFQIDAPNDAANLEKITDILTKAGIDQQYIDEIQRNRELFSKLIAFEVLRFDTVAGLNESFGIVAAGTFEDNSRTRAPVAVRPLVRGRTYIYQVRLLLRAASTLFDSATVTNVDPETGRSYSIKMRKFNSPKTLYSGTLKSTLDQFSVFSKTGVKITQNSSSDAELIEGITSLVVESQATIPAQNTVVNDLIVESSSRGNLVKWRVSQGLQQIDHFIIFAEYNGTRAPLGAVHAVGQDEIAYLDDKLATSGRVRYFVQPVYVDFNDGPAAGPAEV